MTDETAPPEVPAFIDRVVDLLRRRLAEDLVSVIVHGSLAMGDFHPPKSDIDVLAVSSRRLAAAERIGLLRDLAGLHTYRPTRPGLEFSLLSQADLSPFVHPSPFEVHFSASHVARIRQGWVPPPHAVDADLAAHLTVARVRGIAVHGLSPHMALPAISPDLYIASVMTDAEQILHDETVLAAPTYGVLNLCRTLQLLEAGGHIVASKAEGAAWALTHLDSVFHPLIAAALDAHCADAGSRDWTWREWSQAGWDLPAAALADFRDYVAFRIDNLARRP
jgi:streptomycin 3"-adenylyltransferase